MQVNTSLCVSVCLCNTWLPHLQEFWQTPLNRGKLYRFPDFLFSLKGSKPPPEDIPPQIVHQPSDVVVKAGSPATLSCRASGTPEPIIEWLRNGQPLDLERLILSPRPIVLSDGSLFFLSVVSGRRSQSHEGVYTCVARNGAGKAVSRNASLHIAGESGFVVGV